MNIHNLVADSFKVAGLDPDKYTVSVVKRNSLIFLTIRHKTVRRFMTIDIGVEGSLVTDVVVMENTLLEGEPYTAFMDTFEAAEYIYV